MCLQRMSAAAHSCPRSPRSACHARRWDKPAGQATTDAELRSRIEEAVNPSSRGPSLQMLGVLHEPWQAGAVTHVLQSRVERGLGRGRCGACSARPPTPLRRMQSSPAHAAAMCRFGVPGALDAPGQQRLVHAERDAEQALPPPLPGRRRHPGLGKKARACAVAGQDLSPRRHFGCPWVFDGLLS